MATPSVGTSLPLPTTARADDGAIARADWCRPAYCIDSRHARAAVITAHLQAAWDECVPPTPRRAGAAASAAKSALHDTRLTQAYVAARPELQYLTRDVPWRHMDRRIAPPRLRQACIAHAILHKLRHLPDAAWDTPDMYFNTAACTLLHAPCVVCATAAARQTSGAAAAAAPMKEMVGSRPPSQCCVPLRIGDVLSVPQNTFVRHMRHPLLYVGNGMVLHLTHRWMHGKGRGLVHVTGLVRQRNGSRAPLTLSAPCAPAVRAARVARGVLSMGVWRYHALDANCEHFMADICGTPRRSDALQQGSLVVIPLGLLALCVLLWSGHAVWDCIQTAKRR